jgi:phosphocarrier protein HPr
MADDSRGGANVDEGGSPSLETPAVPEMASDTDTRSAPETNCSALVTIRNRKGLHARASAKFVKCAETFNADIVVFRDGQSVGGTSIMGLMMLAAGPGSVLSIRAEGPEAGPALAALIGLVDDGFGEDCVDD